MREQLRIFCVVSQFYHGLSDLIILMMTRVRRMSAHDLLVCTLTFIKVLPSQTSTESLRITTCICEVIVQFLASGCSCNCSQGIACRLHFNHILATGGPLDTGIHISLCPASFHFSIRGLKADARRQKRFTATFTLSANAREG